MKIKTFYYTLIFIVTILTLLEYFTSRRLGWIIFDIFGLVVLFIMSIVRGGKNDNIKKDIKI